MGPLLQRIKNGKRTGYVTRYTSISFHLDLNLVSVALAGDENVGDKK